MIGIIRDLRLFDDTFEENSDGSKSKANAEGMSNMSVAGETTSIIDRYENRSVSIPGNRASLPAHLPGFLLHSRRSTGITPFALWVHGTIVVDRAVLYMNVYYFTFAIQL